MLKISCIKVDQLRCPLIVALFCIVLLYTLPLSAQTTQSTNPSLLIDYIQNESLDTNVVCKRPKLRDPICTNDFDICNQFKTVYDYYSLSYGLGGLAQALANTSDAKRAQELQQKTQELVQQARQGGQDINVAAFDTIDGNAKGELVWLRSKQAMHMSLGGYLAFLIIKWPDPNKSYQSKSCDMATSGMQCISSPDDKSGMEGCLEDAEVSLSDYQFMNISEERAKKILAQYYIDSRAGTSEFLSDIKPQLIDFGVFINQSFEILINGKLHDLQTTKDIPLEDCKSTDIIKFAKIHFTKKLYPFLQASEERMKCSINMKKIVKEIPLQQVNESSGPPIFSLREPALFKISITACQHLCNTNFNFYSFVIPNYEQRNKLQQFAMVVKRNLDELNAKIAQIQGLRAEIDKERQAYLDSLKDQSTGTTDGGTTETEKVDCAKNPYLAGCVGRYGNNSNQRRVFERKQLPVPTASTDDNGGGIVEADKGSGGIKPNTTGSGGGGGAPSAGGDGGGGGGAPSAASTGNIDEDKKKNDQEQPPLDLQGVSDYGGKKKKFPGSGGASSYSVGKTSKTKNPFADLFDAKKNGKDERGGIHLRDIASDNAAVDEENGFSNLFTRITKTYIKKYHQGVVGDKKSSK